MLQRTSEISDFWKPVSEFEGQESSQQYSRYLSDFDELQPLGEQIALYFEGQESFLSASM